jgi:hypothetical protein
MSTRRKSSNQPNYLKKVVALAITDEKFRRALKTDHKKAIDSKRARLKFDHTKLSQRSHDVLASLTEEELDMLYSIHQKAKKGGIKPVEMF